MGSSPLTPVLAEALAKLPPETLTFRVSGEFHIDTGETPVEPTPAADGGTTATSPPSHARVQCPNCSKQALRRRGENTRRNISLRTTGDIHDRWVCDACEWTGDGEFVAATEQHVQMSDGESGLTW